MSECEKCKAMAKEIEQLKELLDIEIVLSMRLERELKDNREWLQQNGHPAYMPPVKIRNKVKPYGKTGVYKNRIR